MVLDNGYQMGYYQADFSRPTGAFGLSNFPMERVGNDTENEGISQNAIESTGPKMQRGGRSQNVYEK
jgi:hypothetical protein